ncbi:hypothetical protein QBC35DRAFT_494779, partial [Podospora australis]
KRGRHGDFFLIFFFLIFFFFTRIRRVDAAKPASGQPILDLMPINPHVLSNPPKRELWWSQLWPQTPTIPQRPATWKLVPIPSSRFGA